MLNKFKNKIIIFLDKYSSSFISWIIKIITTLAAFVAILAFLQTRNINVVQLFSLFVQNVANLLQFGSVPVIVWIIVVPIVCLLWWQNRKINLVAGEFKDDFNHGLSKWEYNNEGWKIEKENGEIVLSVSQSPNGGISKKGFSWTDYKFSFDMKLINKSVGWIVRAENINKYIMVQFNMEKDKLPMLRLHLRIPKSEKRNYEWIVLQEDIINQININKLEWFNAVVVVLGSNIDVYINRKHVAHYYIPDPVIALKEYRQVVDDKETEPSKEDIDEKAVITLINFAIAGRVGFRCWGDEHAHFKNIKVEPLI